LSNRRKPRQANTGAASVQTSDSFQNFVAHVGRGTGNQGDSAHYGFNPVTRNRMQMDWVYRGSWIAGRVIDVMAKDMTREGVNILSGDDPKRIAEFERNIDGLQLWKQLCNLVQWARLYGGAIGFLMVDGQDPSTPLRLETVQKGQFKGILPMDRWVANPSLQDLVEDYGINYGKPMFYDTMPDTGGMPRLKIHYSRVIRVLGVELPYWQSITENLWGQSVLERLWDRMIAYDSTTSGVSQLVYKAHLRILKMDGLRDVLGGNKVALKGIMANIDMIRAMQTNEGITLLDKKDEFETQNYTFSGLDSILMQFGEQLAGATEIPLVRLFGQSPSGFSTGDTDIQTYYDTVKQAQVNQLGPGCDTLYRLAYISYFGKEPPKDFSLEFRSLWQMNDGQKAEIADKLTTAITGAYDKQLIDRATGMQELKASSKITGVFTNIDDAAIKEAENDPPPSPEALGLVAPEPPADAPGGDPEADGEDGGGPDPAPDAEAGAFSMFDAMDAGWEESKHKRGNAKNKGQFGAGGSGASAAAPTARERHESAGGGSKLPFVNEFLAKHPNKASALAGIKALPKEKLQQARELIAKHGRGDDDAKYLKELIDEAQPGAGADKEQAEAKKAEKLEAKIEKRVDKLVESKVAQMMREAGIEPGEGLPADPWPDRKTRSDTPKEKAAMEKLFAKQSDQELKDRLAMLKEQVKENRHVERGIEAIEKELEARKDPDDLSKRPRRDYNAKEKAALAKLKAKSTKDSFFARLWRAAKAAVE
jgi:phage-related protein (TIGR01555 family)